MNEDVPTLIAHNKTTFFKREIYLYALGDIKFKKPIPIKKVAYFMGFVAIWTFPLLLIFGLIPNPFYVALIIVPPIVAAIYVTKPVFGGKTLIPFIKTMASYLGEAKVWNDLKGGANKGDDHYYIESEIWIGRRRELALLSALKAAREAEEKENLEEKDALAA